MPETLSDVLNGYSVPTLVAMVSYNNLVIKDVKSKSVYVRLLTELFSNHGHIQRVYHELQPVEREVVDTLLRQHGTCSTYGLEHHMASRKLIDFIAGRKSYLTGNPPDFRKPVSRNLEDILARLLVRGLVFGVRPLNPYGQPLLLDFNLAQEYFIPSAVRSNLPEPSPLPEWVPPASPAPEVMHEGSARGFQRDLYFYWSYFRSNPVQLTSRGLIPKRSLTALNDTLLSREVIHTGQGENDFPRLGFLRGMLSSLQVIKEDGSFLKARSDPSFFSKTPLERIKTCFDLYANGHFINELAWYPNLVIGSNGVQPIPTPDPIIDARRAFLLYLKPATHWITFESLIEHIQDVDFEFLFKRSFRGNEYTTTYSYGYPSHPYSSYTNPFGWSFNDISNNADGWERVESQFIRKILLRPLYWMGLVNLGYAHSEVSQPDSFCLTPLGAWLLAGNQPPEIKVAGGRVILQPNFQVTAFDPISDATLLNLDCFCERISADRAIEFRLTQASIYNGQQQGWDDNRILSYLAEITGVPVPENVTRTLWEWQTLHERIKVYPRISLLRASQPTDLDDLYQEPGLKNFLKERPAPGLVIVVGRTTIPRLVNALVEKTWVPILFQSDQKMPVGVVEVDSEGLIQFVVPNPNLYLHGHLARFADPDDQGGYQVTASSVQRATRNGMQAPIILSELKKVIRGNIPTILEKRILAWSGHYGEATLEEVVLFQVQNESILNELLEDPELGALLNPIHSNDIHCVTRVHPSDLPRLRKLLEERGIKTR